MERQIEEVAIGYLSALSIDKECDLSICICRRTTHNLAESKNIFLALILRQKLEEQIAMRKGELELLLLLLMSTYD